MRFQVGIWKRAEVAGQIFIERWGTWLKGLRIVLASGRSPARCPGIQRETWSGTRERDWQLLCSAFLADFQLRAHTIRYRLFTFDAVQIM
jgi:hypothetical protein